MTQLDAEAAGVLALARSGNVRGAIVAGEALLVTRPRDAGLTLFIGVLACRAGDLAHGLDLLRKAVEIAPADVAAKVELGRALLVADLDQEAADIAAPLATAETPLGRELQRIQARALLRDDRSAEALPLFEALVAADDKDFESWEGLASARLVQDDTQGALDAATLAMRLQPRAVAHWLTLARAHGARDEADDAVRAAREAVALAPSDVAARMELARALAADRKFEEAVKELAVARPCVAKNAILLSDLADIELSAKAYRTAEADYREALSLRPDLSSAWRGLGHVLERTNRPGEALAAIADGERAGVAQEDMELVRARSLRSQGKLEEALAAANRAPTREGASRLQLIGDIADRLGDTDRAFAAFSEANASLEAAAGDARSDAQAYLERFKRLTGIVTPAWYAGWPPHAASEGIRAPLFIFGFPRSGTTLIDTMLSGHAGTAVLEEEETIDRTAADLGPMEDLPSLSATKIAALRRRYFEEVDKIVPDRGDRLIVDKNPLGLISLPVLHRIFPGARFVFAERHPYDVVLSCFMTSDRMNAKVASFFDFAGTARLYDRVLTYWERCRTVLDLDVHTVRYERLIANPERELRDLAMFAGLEWDDTLLANPTNAAKRSYIDSPSYAQVAEPIYSRANGRWRRYRRHMAPVIDTLQPWIERLGYETIDK